MYYDGLSVSNKSSTNHIHMHDAVYTFFIHIYHHSIILLKYLNILYQYNKFVHKLKSQKLIFPIE